MAFYLFDCGYSMAPDGCAFIEAQVERCVAQDFSAEKWEEIAGCMDPDCGHDGRCKAFSCTERLACIQQVAPSLVE